MKYLKLYEEIEQNIMDDPNIRQDIVDSFQDLIDVDGDFLYLFIKIILI